MAADIFFTLVDDYPRATWTILLTTKQHVCSTIKDFIVYAQNHFNNN